MIGAVLAFLWRRPALYAQMLLALVTAELSARVLKELVGRDRPTVRYPRPNALVHVPHTPSFPSAHAATAFACAVILAAGPSRRIAPLALLLAAAIAFSRVYVGVHYPLDVLAGAALGVVVALAVRRLVTARTGMGLRRLKRQSGSNS